jgi:amino acid transporter/mannitol/fructose-specific phosphotransferase system IIA component (Ntr-type)
MAILSQSKKLKKELRFFDVFMIATGATIASGFFLLPGLAFAQAGPAMIISYFIAALPVIPAIFSKAELATAMPRAGGVYFFLDRSMGPLMGTIGGLGTWLALILKTSFALVGIGAYLHLFFPQIEILPLTIVFALFFGFINILGVKKTGRLQAVLVISLLSILTWFLSASIRSVNPSYFQGFFDQGLHSVFSTAGLVYVSYVGLSKVASISEEVKNPEKSIPLAMFLALGIAFTIYILGTIIMTGVIPAEKFISDLTPAATAAEQLFGFWGSVLISIAAIFAFFSVANAGILSSSRYPLAMSRDHLLPKFLRRLSKQNVPVNSIFLTVGLVIFVIISFDPVKIAKLAGAFQLLLFSLVSLAVIVMRESRIHSYDPGFRSPFYPWMQIFGIFSPLWLIYEMGWLPSVVSIGIIILGIAWYFYFAHGKVIREGAIYHIFARLGQRQFDGLDSELRSILKEKGLRDKDPFDSVVASAEFIDIQQKLTFREVIEKASHYLSQRVPVETDKLINQFLEGTLVGATPVSHGAALPHLRLPEIDHSELIIVRCKAGTCIGMESVYIGDEATHENIFAFFFLVSPEDNPGQHLRILAQIALHVDDESFIEKWRAAKNEQDIKEILLRDDHYLSLTINRDDRTAYFIDKDIEHLNLPAGSLVAIIHREEEIIIPRGKTRLQEFDRLTIIGYPQGIQELYERYIEDSAV